MTLSLTTDQKQLRARILELSYKHKLSHIGSCLSAVDLIEAAYQVKKPDEKFILSGGHAHLAHMVVMEAHGGKKIDKIHDIHCNPKDGCDVSTGSLGQGLPIALGMALADRSKNVYCEITDGEMAEGSIWEALRIASENKVWNLKLMVNANGYSAYKETDIGAYIDRMRAFGWAILPCSGHIPEKIMRGLKLDKRDAPIAVFTRTHVNQYPFLEGIDAHYYVMTEEDYDGVRKM